MNEPEENENEFEKRGLSFEELDQLSAGFLFVPIRLRPGDEDSAF